MLALQRAYLAQRPLEPRISGFAYARFPDELDCTEVEIRAEFTNQDALADGLIADRPDDEHVDTLPEPGKGERACLAGESPTHECTISFRQELQRQERECGFGLHILHLAKHSDAVRRRLCQRRRCRAEREQKRDAVSKGHGKDGGRIRLDRR